MVQEGSPRARSPTGTTGLAFRMGLPWRSQVSVPLPYVWNEGPDPVPKFVRMGGGRGPVLQGAVAGRRHRSQSGRLRRLDFTDQPRWQLRTYSVCLRLPGRLYGFQAVRPARCISRGVVSYDFIVPNSDRSLSSVDVGLSRLVWNRTLLNITAQFGITGHVPDFRLITSLPIRNTWQEDRRSGGHRGEEVTKLQAKTDALCRGGPRSNTATSSSAKRGSKPFGTQKVAPIRSRQFHR
jgi:hypothetical protein